MDTISLWEQEIAQKEVDEKALNESKIYNFYGDVEPVNEKGFFKKLGKEINHSINKKQKEKFKLKKSENIKDKEVKFSAKKASSGDFDRLCNSEAMCAEGFVDPDKEENQKVIADYFAKRDWANGKEIKLYWCRGKDLNDYYKLTGDNRYPDDLGILFVDWMSFYNKKSNVSKGNFRWFSDVVDNNARREIEAGNEHYKNYHSFYGDDWFWGTCKVPEDWKK